MIKQLTNIPKLRFPSFKNEWESKTINDIATKVGSGSTPLGGEKTYQTDGVVFIRSQNVNNDKLLLKDVVYISDKINSKMTGSVVKARDILLNITGASLGRSCVVPENFKIGNVNQHVCIIRLSENYDPYFLQPYLSSERGQKKMLESQTGSGREGLNFQSIRKFNISIPSLPEQQKIASFLTSVDTKIQQLTQKKTVLEQYKKGVIQKFFDQKVRFKDKNSKDFPEWEVST